MAETEESHSHVHPPPAEADWQLQLPRTFLSSTNSAIRAMRLNSSAHLRSLQELGGNAESQLKRLEDSLLKRVKEEFKVSTREHPLATAVIGVAAALLALPRTRSFFFRHTLARFQSQEAQFVKAENNVKELSLSVDLIRNESRKLLERASLAERDMKYGHTELLSLVQKAGNQMKHVAKSVYKVEAEAADVMDSLRETPGREALKLRAEVASVLTNLKRHRLHLDKRILNISDLGIAL